MVLTLLIVTAIAGSSLGFIYQLTKAPIEAAATAKQQEAIELVMPGFDNDPAAEMYEIQSDEGFVLKVFPAKKEGEFIGAAIESVTNKGFSGEIRIMVGMKPNGDIVNYQILEHKETPGLGTQMDDWFKPAEAGAEEKSRSAFFDAFYGIKAKAEGGEDTKSIIGKNPGTSRLTVRQDGGEVDAITAATITSRAFLHAVEVAYKTFTEKADAASSATKQEEGGAE
ncbi:RnfABCDGE type electron transport complex subunit G [Geofilum rubicundum]|nr:RnfABCDGE type electron transport complex subunit G [Geofilum rubicundum]